MTNSEAPNETAQPSGEARTPITLEERLRIKKQMGDQAVKFAISGQWEQAVEINRNMLTLLGEEHEIYNRLGKALMEVGKITDARSAYARSLEIDPTNTIARRNLDRLGSMQDASGSAPSMIDTRMFVEESGKSTPALLQAVDPDVLADVDAGDVVVLKAEGNAVNAYRTSGEYVGMVEPRIGLRLSRLMNAGNRYSAALITASGDIRVMIRETYQDPTQVGRVSFPRSSKVDVRAYTRRGLLQPDLEDLELGDDDDDGGFDDTEDDRWSDSGGDDSGDIGVNIEPEDESYD